MLNAALYKRGIRECWKTLLIFAAILTMYFTLMVTMFDPEIGSALDEFAKAMPELMAMFGMNPAASTLIGFMSAYLYGFIMLQIPMLFSILRANRLVARHVESGSMVCLLAAPARRKTVAFTQLTVLVSGIFAIMLYATVLGIAVCEISFPGELEIGKYILLNAGLLCLQLFIGAICFLFSCIFGDTKYSVGLGAGIPELAFLIQMLANAGGKLENAKYATFFTLFQPDSIIAGDSAAIQMLVLLAGAALLFYAAVLIFDRKDLHI